MVLAFNLTFTYCKLISRLINASIQMIPFDIQTAIGQRGGLTERDVSKVNENF